MTLDLKEAGDVIYLMGSSRIRTALSQYLVAEHGVNLSPAPYFNLDEEYQVQQVTAKLIEKNLLCSAHDCSEGGLFINLLESAMVRNLGFDIHKTNANLRNDAYLFGEAQGRIVVSLNPSNANAVESLLSEAGVAFEKLGAITSGEIAVNGQQFGDTTDYAGIYNTSLENQLN